MGQYGGRSDRSGPVGMTGWAAGVAPRASAAALAAPSGPSWVPAPCLAEGQDDRGRDDKGSRQAGGDDFHDSSIAILPRTSKDGPREGQAGPSP